MGWDDNLITFLTSREKIASLFDLVKEFLPPHHLNKRAVPKSMLARIGNPFKLAVNVINNGVPNTVGLVWAAHLRADTELKVATMYCHTIQFVAVLVVVVVMFVLVVHRLHDKKSSTSSGSSSNSRCNKVDPTSYMRLLAAVGR